MIFKCKMCGGDIEPIENTNTGKCLYCKSVMTLPNLDDEKKVNLYNRANELRLASEFDKAYQVYEEILEIDNKEVEAHWGLLLCKYGIEYVDDPKSKKKIPTCHRTLTDSILTERDYKYVVKNSYGEALELYQEEAKKINEIQKGILEISNKEEPYDVFICYKETDDMGERTHESVIAEDIYEALTKEGYKVFFSRITLEDKLGKEYEPYIYSALKTSKVMLVVGTSKEHFEAVWVKNEWSRFKEFMKKDKSKVMIPVYSKIDAYKLPEEFSNFQAQNMDKIGAMQDLIRGVKKILTAPKTNNDIDEYLEKRLEEASDGVKSLGNGNYEVVQVKQKLPVWYYVFVISMFFITSSLMLTCVSTTNFNILSTFGYDSVLPFFKATFYIMFIVGGLGIAALIAKLTYRKTYKLAKSIYLIMLLIIYILALILLNKYIIVFIYWYLLGISLLVLYFVNPKWHLDTSSKVIVDREGRDALEEKNKFIRENFKIKTTYPIKTKYIIIAMAICFLIYVGCFYKNFLRNNSNSYNESISQIKIKRNYINMRSEPKIYSSYYKLNYIGFVKKGEVYNIIDKVYSEPPSTYEFNIDNNCSYWYLIETKNKIKGYICGAVSDNIFAEEINKPFISSQSNERNENLSQLEIVNNFIRIRETRSANSQKLGNVYRGEIYTIYEQKKIDKVNWYKIKTNEGITGYISGGKENEYIKILERKG